MKFSLQNAALWITQLRCARSKSGQLREPTNGHGREARAAAREPIRISRANPFPRTYLETEESSQHSSKASRPRPEANDQFFSFKKGRGDEDKGGKDG